MSTTVPDRREDPPVTGRRIHPGLIALAVGGFGIGLTEFVIAGLLSDVARDLDVSVPTAGSLVSVYAFAVVVGAFTVTAVLARRPPKGALLVLFGFFIAGNALTAWAPTFEVALAGRFVAAMCHGGFFGIGAVLAGDLVHPSRRASAIAIMFGGLTAANVLGVPFGTFVGQHLGWRAAFWVVAAVGVVAMAGIARLVPRRPAPAPVTGSSYAVLLRPQVLVSIALTTLVFGGVFGAFMYVEPLVTHVTGYSSGAVPWLLVLFGVGLFAGNLLGGWAADRDLTRTFRVLAVALPLTLVLYAVVAPWKVPVALVLVVLGLVGFAATPPLQVRVMNVAGDAPTMASAANIAAFNLGNALGVVLGGAAISAGLGWVSPVWVGAGMALLGGLLVLVTRHEGHGTVTSEVAS